MTITSAPRNPTIADLWRELRAWLAAALAATRGPAAVAKILTRAAHGAFKRRLHFIESLLMKLLLVEAARAPVPPASSRQIRANSCTAADNQKEIAGWKPAVRSEDPARPETWRVCFRPRLRGLLKRSPSQAPRPLPTRRIPAAIRVQTKARALARRFESIRRVIANPRRAIAALARRLRALGRAARALAQAIALARPPRCASMPMPLAHAMVRANDASAAFHNTS
jgi:hypothetical protein